MPLSKKQLIGLVIIFSILLAGIVIILNVDPIAQNPNYHVFSDARTLFDIPNFLNVISNLPFLLIGFLGVQKIMADKLVIIQQFRSAYLIVFAGLMLVSLGSVYYHLWPANATLVWDRLPMVMVFMSLFSVIIAELISLKTARLIIWPLFIMGVSSVIYWHFGEINGQGDLRFYALVQFLPMLMIPVILICFDPYFSRSDAYWWVLLFYLLAKFFEHYDAQVYSAMGFISGHTLKHLFAAAGMWVLLVSYGKRKNSCHTKNETFV